MQGVPFEAKDIKWALSEIPKGRSELDKMTEKTDPWGRAWVKEFISGCPGCIRLHRMPTTNPASLPVPVAVKAGMACMDDVWIADRRFLHVVDGDGMNLVIAVPACLDWPAVCEGFV